MKSFKREMVFDRGLGRLRPIGRAPVLTSAPLEWRGYLLEVQQLPSLDACDVIWLNNMVFVQLNRATVERKSEGRFVPQRLRPGHVTILPAQGSTHSRSDDPLDVLVLSIDPTFMASACGELLDDRFELMVLHGIEDRFIEGVCLALKKEVEHSGKSGRLYSDSLVTSLAVHLASKHSNRKLSALRGGRPAPRVIRRAKEFIDENSAQDLSLNEIASSVKLSPFHFSRVFKEHTGLSPYQYLLKRRIERARQMLVRGEHSLTDVALEVGFYDQSHFAVHFKRVSGMTPKQFLQHCGRRRKGRSGGA
ncbi:MAG: AraC family transcriptional regulator [Verrucomicrobia subdivision 3 bacterium]|nr:AraC family transcriptional regulator [Limisphaerales bacterium]